MRQSCTRFAARYVLSTFALLAWRGAGWAIPLDANGDLKLGIRTYVNARVGTEDTHNGAAPTGSGSQAEQQASQLEFLINGTFPHSNAGHLRQNRVFIEVDLKHDLEHHVKQGPAPFTLLNELPFQIKGLRYEATFRGEGDSLYNWGPREYSTASAFNQLAEAAIPFVNPFNPNQLLIKNQGFLNVGSLRHQVRSHGTNRQRLFQAFLEGSVGHLFVRAGKQVLSWGETDGFQLLDHINPLDNSFGGILIPLDERRVPLDMIRADYYLGEYGPISEAFLQGYAAIDNHVGYLPTPPYGSPWVPPALGAPVFNVINPMFPAPPRTVKNTRGGVQLKFNALDATFGVAHYYTFFDIPALQGYAQRSLLTAFDDGMICPLFDAQGHLVLNDQGQPIPDPDPTHNHCGAPTHLTASAPKVQVSGASTTFAVPQFYSVVRSEVAYFKDEPAFTQGQLDPFLYHPQLDTCPAENRVGGNPNLCSGGRRLRDSINAVIGLDVNQWIRMLNPNQTFLISTQFFYKHIKNAGSGNVLRPNCDPSRSNCLNPDREVLPVPALAPYPVLGRIPIGQTFISQPQDQFLQTLLVTTSYRSGTINPIMVLFYDWGGAFLYQPSVVFSRDPFRFSLAYSIVDAHTYKGGSGVSLLKDRDNIEFRLEYVL
jgi:hypothetical protein